MISDATVEAGTPHNVNLMYQFPGTPDAGPDVVSYLPPPYDVISDTARQIPAPRIIAFPLT